MYTMSASLSLSLSLSIYIYIHRRLKGAGVVAIRGNHLSNTTCLTLIV